IIPLFIMIILIGFLIEQGIEINKELSYYRVYKLFFGFKYGKWKPLPNISYISLYKAKRIQKTNMGRAMDYKYSNVYEVNLFDSNSHSTTLFETDIEFLKETKDCARQISEYLNIPLLDVTS
ncbi:MAG TPA: hypothetical protein VLY87_06820, partial [Flavobacterium sp.]|nr:hypothetical protein [Flavobacterium sp.]